MRSSFLRRRDLFERCARDGRRPRIGCVSPDPVRQDAWMKAVMREVSLRVGLRGAGGAR